MRKILLVLLAIIFLSSSAVLFMHTTTDINWGLVEEPICPEGMNCIASKITVPQKNLENKQTIQMISGAFSCVSFLFIMIFLISIRKQTKE